MPADATQTFHRELHVAYITEWYTAKGDLDFVLAEYLRMSGLYWSITALDLLGERDKFDRSEVLKFVHDSRCANGGFAASPGNDAHLLYTLSAMQILVTYNSLDSDIIEGVTSFVSSLQRDDGSFVGDEWREKDTRFSFCALATLALVQRLDAVNVDKAVEYILTCMNFDGGFGTTSGSETHAGQIFCCVGALAIAGATCATRATCAVCLSFFVGCSALLSCLLVIDGVTRPKPHC